MTIEQNAVAIFELVDKIIIDLDDYFIAAVARDYTEAQEIRRRAAMSLDACFDLVDGSIAQCHALAAQRRAEAARRKLTLVNGGLS